MIEPTQEQHSQICADLARAMGWTLCHDGYGISPDATTVPPPRQLPNFFTSAADSRALVEWLAMDDTRWKSFRREILMEWVMTSEQDVVRWVMTAPLPVIALAAHRALGLEVKE